MTRLLLPLVFAVIFPWSGGNDAAKPHKTGGDFQVESITGVTYFEGDDSDPVRHKLDLYLPKGQKDFPVVIFVHGGTWKSGSKDLYAPIAKLWAKNGIGAAVINYRLSPKHKHPAHIEDVARAFAWVHANIAKHGGDPKNIFLCGHSAGGHLVSLLSTNEDYLKPHKLKISDIKGTIPISGVFIIIPNLMFKDIFGDNADVVKSASPIEHVKGMHPPSLLIYADKDILSLDAMAEQMCKKLKGCDCETTTLKVDNRTHLTIITSMVNETDPATQALLEFVSKHGGLKLQDAKKK